MFKVVYQESTEEVAVFVKEMSDIKKKTHTLYWNSGKCDFRAMLFLLKGERQYVDKELQGLKTIN